MINPYKEVNWSPDIKARKSFAISWIIGFPIIALIMFVLKGMISGNWSLTIPSYIASVGAGLGVLLWLIPQIALPFYRVCYAFGCTMGFIIGNTLLSLFYFLVVTPIGILRRTLGKPAIIKSPTSDRSTYWEDVKPTTDPKRYYQQY